MGGSGVSLDSLSAWTAATGTDAHSISADPDFLDIAGADNILGYALVAGAYRDGGADDNFVLDAGSPAIDSGDSWSAPPTDFLGDPRQDDPGSPNAGSPDYFGSVQSSSLFAATGAAQGWSGTNTSFNLTLPFAFPFYGTSYTEVQVSSEGFLQFAYASNTGSAGDPNDSDASLIANRRIAPLWADITTSSIFVNTTVAGQVTIRWQGTNNADGSPVNFDVVLFQNGDIRFDYGAGNTNLDATVGLSYGNGWAYKLPSGYDGQSSLTNADSILFTLAPGFVDMAPSSSRARASITRRRRSSARSRRPSTTAARIPRSASSRCHSARRSTRSMPTPRRCTNWSRREVADSAAPTTWSTP